MFLYVLGTLKVPSFLIDTGSDENTVRCPALRSMRRCSRSSLLRDIGVLTDPFAHVYGCVHSDDTSSF